MKISSILKGQKRASFTSDMHQWKKKWLCLRKSMMLKMIFKKTFAGNAPTVSLVTILYEAI